MNLKNKTVTVFGFARSGIAVAHAALRLGAKAKITEYKPKASFGDDFAALSGGDVAYEFGGHTEAFVKDSDLIVLSPGVPFTIPVLEYARAKGIEVIGEIEFAARLCPCPIVAVTGSNGKTTTATLIAQILKAAGHSVCLCGNIGSPFAAHVLGLKANDYVVLEISSFQLESTVSFKPHVAVWLNFSQNHLDRHKDLDEYFQAKAKIALHQHTDDIFVTNAKDPLICEFAKKVKSQVMYFNTPQDPADIQNPNYLAAMKATMALGVTEEVCRRVFAQFKGVEHRLEWVRTLDGVDYINDSKSTTAQAGRWALERATKPVIMICGGRDKHIDFSVLKDLVREKVKHMIARGEARSIMTQTFKDVVSVEEHTDFKTAIDAARAKAKSGDCVLLSPMCASFDMFNDFEHRGRVFKEMVNGLL